MASTAKHVKITNDDMGMSYGEEEDDFVNQKNQNEEVKPKTTSVAPGGKHASSFRKIPDFSETYKYPLDHLNVENLVNMLSKIHLVWPEDLPHYDELEFSLDPDRANFPRSYYQNTDKEKVVLWHAENFRRQFINKFPNRRPPVIAPTNECGCQKLFPTYINPTSSGYPEFLDCVSTVTFLKDFFSPTVLSPPTKFPERIRSHTTAIKRRKTNAFEMAVIIVSLLKGSGYDAYVVDGFASKTICTIDTTDDYSEPEEKPILDYEVDREKEEQERKEKEFGLGGLGFGPDYSYLLEKEEETPLVPVSPSKYRFKVKATDYSDPMEVIQEFDDLFELSQPPSTLGTPIQHPKPARSSKTTTVAESGTTLVTESGIVSESTATVNPASGTTLVTESAVVTESKGTINAASGTTEAGVVNESKGTIAAASGATIVTEAGVVDESKGTIAAASGATIATEAGVVDESKATIEAANGTTVVSEAGVVSESKGTIDAASGATIPKEAGVVDGSKATIEAASGTTVVTEAGVVNESKGTIDATSGATIPTEAGVVDGSKATIEAASGTTVVTEAGVVSESKGTIDAASGTTVVTEAGVVSELTGTIDAASGATIATEAGVVDESKATIEAASGATIATEAGVVDESKATIEAASGATIATEAEGVNESKEVIGDDVGEEHEDEEEEEEMEEEVFEELPASVKDRYHGRRTHAWILVLPGTREIDEAFFLEPFSGTWRPLKDPNFLSVEAVFNEKNYWINIQPPVRNLKLMNWDLSNPSAWSKLLVESDRKKKKKKETGAGDAGGSVFQDDDEDDVNIKPGDLFLTMPVAWAMELEISQEDYDRKYPEGSKTIEFNDAIMEVAAPYANPDGLVRKVLKFSGSSRDPEDLEYIEETFQHRKDKLTKRKWLREGKLLHEYFDKGRKDALKEHVHVSGRNRPDFPRDLYYYANAHPRSVAHRKIIKKGMIEHFEGRDDLLYFKTTLYGGILCNTIPNKEDKNRGKAREIMELVKGLGGGGSSRKSARRKIIKIVEKYHRNDEKDYKEDIAEKHMLVDDARLRILFHYQLGNLTRNSLEFFKMAKPGQSKYAPVEFKPEDCIEYHADRSEPPMDVYKKFTLLHQMDRDERSSSVLSREAEDEIYHTVTSRIQEDWRQEIEPDAFAGDRNEEFLKMMKEQQPSDENVGESDLSGTDFTTPFFEKYGVPKNKRDEILMKKRIMLHEKVKIMRRAYMIKELYEKEAATLKEKQDWYELHADQMNPTQEEDFTHMYKERLFQMHILEQRMVRHQQETPRLYYNLLVHLLRHPQLNRFTNKKVPPPPPPDRTLTLEEKARIAKELAKLKDCCQFFNIRFSEKKGKNKKHQQELEAKKKQEEEERKAKCVRKNKRGSNTRRSSGGKEILEPNTAQREDDTTTATATTIAAGETDFSNI